MRRRAALLLAALAAAPALAQAPAEGPPLTIVHQPTYSVGDFWQYRITLVGPNATGVPQEQTVRVAALEDYGGVPAIRLFTQSVQEILGDEQSGSFYATSNKTTWYTQQGHRILRIEEENHRTQYSSVFRVLTARAVNWTFHEPMDLYQYPIVKDDAWVVLTNATIDSNTTIHTHVANNPPGGVPTRYENGTIYQASSSQWLRADRLNITGRTYEGVLMVSVSGNASIRDFYAPSVGNLVRREIYNETGDLVETSTLLAYQLAAPPGPPGGNRNVGTASASWLPVAGAAVAGIIIALAILAATGRLRRRPPEAPKAAPPEEPREAPPPPPEEPRREPGEGGP